MGIHPFQNFTARRSEYSSAKNKAKQGKVLCCLIACCCCCCFLLAAGLFALLLLLLACLLAAAVKLAQKLRWKGPEDAVAPALSAAAALAASAGGNGNTALGTQEEEPAAPPQPLTDAAAAAGSAAAALAAPGRGGGKRGRRAGSSDDEQASEGDDGEEEEDSEDSTFGAAVPAPAGGAAGGPDDVASGAGPDARDAAARPWTQHIIWYTQMPDWDRVVSAHYREIDFFTADDPQPLVEGKAEGRAASLRPFFCGHPCGRPVAIGVALLTSMHCGRWLRGGPPRPPNTAGCCSCAMCFTAAAADAE